MGLERQNYSDFVEGLGKMIISTRERERERDT